jgi:hypothetical protein
MLITGLCNVRELELRLFDTKYICLLCKRQFKTIEQLQKHETRSELHKTNLELARQKQLLAKETEHPPNEESHQKRSREDSSWNTDNDSDWDKGNKNRKTDQGGGALGAGSILSLSPPPFPHHEPTT